MRILLTAALGLAALALAGAATVVAADRRIVYLLGAPRTAYVDLGPEVIPLGFGGVHRREGGLIAAELDGEGERDLIVTTPGRVAAYDGDGERLWLVEADIQLTGKAELHGLPGQHAPGVQAADIDGDGGVEVMFLTRAGALTVLDGATGVEEAVVVPPPPPAEAERWEHLVVADFRGGGDRDLVLQATNREGYRMGRFLAAFAIESLLTEAAAAEPLWRRDDFLANAHQGARVADLDRDGRDEVLGGDVIGPDGRRLLRLPVRGHLDALLVANVRPDIPGLEVVALEEHKGLPAGPAPQHVFLYNAEGLIWSSRRGVREPQNAAVGEFDLSRPGLEIWSRSRQDRHQLPWVTDSTGELVAAYEMRDVAPIGWTVKGVEEIVAIDWTGDERQLAAAKERHDAGDVAIFDPLTGEFLLRLREAADRLYVADVRGDWREELIVVNGDEIRVYTSPEANPRPDRPSLWTRDHYRRSKQTWTYYSP